MKLGINCGHTRSGAGSGAVGILNESAETRNVGYELMNLLRAGGHEVIDCTIDSAKTQESYLAQAVNLANRQDLDYFISIHFNKTVRATGTEVYTYEGRQFADALEVSANISSVLGIKNRGVKAGTGLYVIRKTKAKSMLIEVCFVDDPDASKYKTVGYKAVAEAIYKAIVDTNVPDTKPSEGANTGSKPNSGYTGNSIVDYLKSIGLDSSYEARKKYAQQYGIANYSGTAGQNTALLNAMRNAQAITPSGNTGGNSGYTGNSIVDYLKSIGLDSSYEARKRYAQQYGIANYSGTAEQNTALLNAMRTVGTSTSTPNNAYYPSFNSNSIVDGLKSIGVDSSYSNRKIIAQANGIANYSGTAEQNETLCNLARQGKLKK